MSHLDESAARALITQISQGKALPERIVTEIMDKTDGVPLFIEELTKTILENLLQQERGHPPGSAEIGELPAIPSTLQDSLMARLDRPGLVKEIAQIGSALGREFRLDLLQAVVDKPASIIDDALAELVAAQLVITWGTAPHLTYRFRHTLIQETAYGSMLRSTRRRLHARIAKVLAQRFRSQVQGRPDLLARHYTLAQKYEQGFRYWFLASQRANRHFAHKEVVVHLRSGLELAPKISDDVELIVMEFEMRAMLASTLMLLNGPGHDEVGVAYQQAFDFCRGREGLLDSFPVKFGLCRYLWATGQIRDAVMQAEALLPLVEEERDPDPGRFMAVHLLLGISLWHRGESERALSFLQRVSACYRADRDAPLFFTYMIDFGVLGGCYEALALMFLGRPGDAAIVARDSLTLARELDNPYAIGVGLLANLMVAMFSGEFEECINFADECIRFSATDGFLEFVALAKVCAGSARLKSGFETGSLRLIQEGVGEWEASGCRAWRPLLRGILAEAHLLLGHRQQASDELAHAQAIMRQQEERQAAAFLSSVETQMSAWRQTL